jgi:hypothetical protein
MILTKLKMVEGGFCTKMGWIFFFFYLFNYFLNTTSNVHKFLDF